MKKRVKAGYRILCLVMVFVLLFVQMDIPSVRAKENNVVHIHDTEELYRLSEQCRTESFSTGKFFYLENDLDISEYEDLFIPFMDGTFNGNGHKITGVSLEKEMSDYGLFRYVGVNGTVQNLTVEAYIVSGEDQKNIGIIVGNNAGIIRNCVSEGSINGQESVGGIAGFNEQTGSIQYSQNTAKVDGKSSVGGIVGTNEGKISDCTNSGCINTSQKVLKAMDGEGSVSISIPNATTGLTSDERANETGGIAGNSSGEIWYCKNTAVIGHEHLGYDTGGIVGRQDGSVSYCSNEGSVYGRKNVGGIAGYFEPFEDTSYDNDTPQELSDQLDELSDLVDGLGDKGDQLGDHMSDNMKILKDQMKGLQDSLKGHLDNLGNLTDSKKDSISNQMDALNASIEAIELDVNLDQLDEYISDIENDLEQVEKIMDELEPLLISAGEDTKKEVEEIVKKYKEIQQLIEKLKEFIKNMGDGNIPNLPDLPEIPTLPELPKPPVGPGDGDSGEESGSEEESEGESENDGEDDSENVEESEDDSIDESDSEENDTENNKNEENPEYLSTASKVGEYEITSLTFKSPVLLGAPEFVNDTDIKLVVQEGEPAEGESGSGSGNSEEDESVSGNGSSTEDESGSGNGSSVGDEASFGGGENIEKLTRLLGELAEYNSDIQSNMRKISGVLKNIPGEISGLKDDFDRAGDSMEALTDTIGDMLDEVSDEFGNLNDDAQRYEDQISDSVEQTTDTFDSDVDAVSAQMELIKDKFGNIRITISDGFDELKERIEERSIYVDVSGLTSSDPGAGKIIACMNSGEIYADSQGGGIVGCIMKENASDITEWMFGDDTDEDNNDIDSITKHVQALVFGCSNTSEVNTQDDYAGGIVGKADYGMISSCQNYGDVTSEDGGYVGGIAGKSENIIRDSYVLCGLNGASYIGGVAGKGEDISGSYVCVYMDMDNYVNSVGAVAGRADGTVENNYFADNGYGAVDGVTRSSEAVGMSYQKLLESKAMPEGFTVFTVKFINGENTVFEKTFAYGDEFAEGNYPKLTEYDGQYSYWEDKDISPIHRNVSIHAVYRAYMPSLSADSKEEKPEVLLGGEFYPDSILSVKELTDEERTSILADRQEQLSGYKVMKVYSYEIIQSEPLRENVSLRIKNDLPSADSIMVFSDKNNLEGKVLAAEMEGSYLAVKTILDSKGYIIVMDKENHLGVIVAVVSVIAVIVLITIFLWRRKSRHVKIMENEDKEEKEAVADIEA